MVRMNLYVLEFNVRMGDPECQSILSRMNSNLLEYLEAAMDERLDSMPPINWTNKSSVCVVMASKGYPESIVRRNYSRLRFHI